MRAVIIGLAALIGATACTPRETRAWLAWHDKDPHAAEQWLAGSRPSSGANGSWVAGNCATFAEEAAAAGLPWGTFSRIAWRESGCNPNSWVHDSDDWGGGLFGLNFISQSLRDGWRRLCGATMDNIRGNVPLQMKCAAAAYHSMGLAPWQ